MESFLNNIMQWVSVHPHLTGFFVGFITYCSAIILQTQKKHSGMVQLWFYTQLSDEKDKPESTTFILSRAMYVGITCVNVTDHPLKGGVKGATPFIVML